MEGNDLLLTVLTAAFTILSPLLIALAKRESWGKVVKIAVPLVVSLAISSVYLSYQGALMFGTPADWLTSFLTIYGLQQLVYTTILRHLATVLEQVGQQPAEATTDDGPDHRA